MGLSSQATHPEGVWREIAQSTSVLFLGWVWGWYECSDRVQAEGRAVTHMEVVVCCFLLSGPWGSHMAWSWGLPGMKEKGYFPGLVVWAQGSSSFRVSPCP